MKIIGDLHIHSRFSRATSSKLTPSWLDRWARIKGIQLLGTGDCTHPGWLEILRAELDDAEDGFYTLTETVRKAFDLGEGLTAPDIGPREAESSLPLAPRFVLTGEISTIYKKDGKTRKVHHLVMLPNFRAAAAFQVRLERAGNIRSDGRPILGLDSRDLLEMLLECDSRSILVPAHIWTPWFSALGAKSGFDSIAECYRDLTEFIPAVETGLSSNPPMNWAVESLDGFSVISNSDAHSPDKIGREATIFEMDCSFASLRNALRPGAAFDERILATVEFFPQEGKYHYDGHRACRVCLGPEEAASRGNICPVCEKPLTPGVMGRVQELANRAFDETSLCPEPVVRNCRPYYSLVPLKEILSEICGTGPASKKVEAAYAALIKNGGSEFSLLVDMPPEKIAALNAPAVPGEILADAVTRVRRGDVFISPGYDGEYGVVRAFAPGHAASPAAGRTEAGLFETASFAADAGLADIVGEAEMPAGKKARPKRAKALAEKKPGYRANKPAASAGTAGAKTAFTPDVDQRRIIDSAAKDCMIIAGPGTGKTAVLAAKIAALVRGGAEPSSILALSFTVKAAGELRERVGRLLAGSDLPADGLFPKDGALPSVLTFHSLCASILREQYEAAGLPADYRILGETAREELCKNLLADFRGTKKAQNATRNLGNYIEERKRFLLLPGETPDALARVLPAALYSLLDSFIPERLRNPPDARTDALYAEYRNRLRSGGLVDYDGLVAGTVRMLALRPETLRVFRTRYQYVFIDEYQDINFAQYALARLLVPRESPASLWVIGDPNQAIYGFRGSDKAFMDRFGQDYPEAARFELLKSFRCGRPIIEAAGHLAGVSMTSVAAASTGAAPAGMAEAGRNHGTAEVSLFQKEFATEKSEAEGIARAIGALVGGTSFFAMDSGAAEGGGALGDFDLNSCAVLVRAAALADPIVKALKDHGIPHVVTGAAKWWQDEPVTRLLALLEERADAGPTNAPLDSLITDAWKTLESEGLFPKRRGVPVPEPVIRLAGLAKLFGSVRALVDGLLSDRDGFPDPAEPQGVKVMTIHASKGLEFDHVFVPALEEGMLPFTVYMERAHITDEYLSEERRLLYVAMTRARHGLWLSRAASRFFRNRVLKAPASRFLDELGGLVPLVKDEKKYKPNPQISLF